MVKRIQFHKKQHVVLSTPTKSLNRHFSKRERDFLQNHILQCNVAHLLLEHVFATYKKIVPFVY